MNKHKGKKRMQKRPNYKNVGEEEDEERGPAEDAQEDAEKTKGTEGGSKSMKTSGEREGECTWERMAPSPTPAPAAIEALCPVFLLLRVCPWGASALSAPTSVPHSGQPTHLEAVWAMSQQSLGCHCKSHLL